MLRKPPLTSSSLTSALFASTAMTGFVVLSSLPAAAQSLPTGGEVASGSVSIGPSSAGGLTITQSSSNAIVNWQGFSIGAGNRVDIVQPGPSSAILNRVTGGTPSTIAGQLNANGEVYLVNPNGIAITKSGKVQAGRGFVASTLGITDEDFKAGKRAFNGGGASAAVSNAGEIAIGTGGYAALIGGEVANSGSISVPMGKVGLGSGEAAVLDLSGDGFLQVAVPTKGSGEGALVDNSGTIRADGGTVVLKAAAAREMARQAVNMSGTIEARSVSGRNGDILLGGGEGVTEISGRIDAGGTGAGETGGIQTGGSVTVVSRSVVLKAATIVASGRDGGGRIRIGGERQGGGTLPHAETVSIDAASRIEADATRHGRGGDVVVWSDVSTVFAGAISATGGALGGHGGEAEVSGKVRLAYTGRTDLSAENGAFGSLLLDPYNVTISSGTDLNQSGFTATGDDSIINAGTLQTALGLANVTVSTGAGGSQPGNITVAAPLSWSAGSTLTLDAANTITVNAAITFGGTAGAGLALNAANALAINAPATVRGTGDVTLAYNAAAATNLSFASGTGLTYAAADGSALVAGAGGTLAINADPYALLYTMADLDGIGAVSDRYALARNLDASGTTYTDALVGGGGSTFSGMFTGLGHSVTGLAIHAPGASYTGLVSASSGTIRDIGLVDASISGDSDVGGLVGFNMGAIIQSTVTGTVSGSDNVGGLAGVSYGTIDRSAAVGAVSGDHSLGGLVGSNYGTITQSASGGSVSGVGAIIGGLVGSNYLGTIAQSISSSSVSGSLMLGGLAGSSDGTILQSASTGAVSSRDFYTGLVAGFVGLNGGPIYQSYWDTQTSGQTDGAGYGSTINPTGLTTAEFQSGSASGLGSAFAGGTGGLYPYLKTFFPNGVQAVSGIAYTDAGATPAASGGAGAVTVTLDANGERIGQASTGANGAYYIAVPSGTLASGASLLAFVPADGALSANAATVGTSTGSASQTGLDLYGNAITAETSATLLSQTPSLAALRAAAATAAGTDGAAAAVVAAATGTGYIATGASFSLDQARTVAAGSSLLVRTLAGSPLTVDAAVTVADMGSLGLVSGGTLRVNAPVTARGLAGINLSYDASDPTNLSFTGGAGLTYVAADGSALSSSAGGALTINAAPYTLLYTIADLDGIDSAAAVAGGAINVQADGMSGRYALADNLDVTGTTYTDPLVGPNLSDFSGTLTGLGHTVTGLTIYAPYLDFTGLVGQSSGTLRDIGLVGASIASRSNVGGLAGSNSGTIARAVVMGAVSGDSSVGGLVGSNSGTIAEATVSGSVSGHGAVGGLVGHHEGAIRQSTATAAVSGDDGTGGLVGDNLGTISLSTATGSVSASGNAGGLVGRNIGGTISQSYWDAETSGRTIGLGADDNSQGANATGLTTAQFQSGAASGLGSAFAGGTSGLYPYLKTFFPNGVQAVSGTAYQDAGATVAASGAAGAVTVSLASGGAVVGSATTGANGYYYITLPSGSLASGAGIVVSTAANGGLSSAAASFARSSGGAVAASGFDLSGTWLRQSAGPVTTLSGLDAAYATAIGSTPAAALTLTNREITAPGTFALDASVAQSGTLSLAAPGALSQTAGTVAAGGLLISGGAVSLTAAGNAVATAAGSGTSLSLVTSGNLAIGTLVRAGGTSLSGITTTGAMSLSATGTLTLASGAAVSGASPVLSAGGAFVNQAGGAAVTATSGRWLIYSANPGGDTFGGLDSANAAIWNKAAGAAVTQGGNRYVFASQPLLTVTSTDLAKTYGDDASVASAYTITGFDPGVSGAYLGDSAATALTGTASVTSAGSAATAGVPGSPYTITAAAGTLATTSGYGLTFASTGHLAVAARAITVTAEDQSRPFGGANPALTYTLGGAGLVNGDVLTGGLATGASAASGVGSYAIMQGSLAASANYRLAFRPGVLTVTDLPDRQDPIVASAWLAGTVARNESLNRAFAAGPSGPLLEGSRVGETDEDRSTRPLVSDARFTDIIVCTGVGRCVAKAPDPAP